MSALVDFLVDHSRFLYYSFSPPFPYTLSILLSLFWSVCLSLSLPGAATVLPFCKWWRMRCAVPMTWKRKGKRKGKARERSEIQSKFIRIQLHTENLTHLLYFCLCLHAFFSLCLPWPNYSMPFPPIAQIKTLRQVVSTATKDLDQGKEVQPDPSAMITKKG